MKEDVNTNWMTDFSKIYLYTTHEQYESLFSVYNIYGILYIFLASMSSNAIIFRITIED